MSILTDSKISYRNATFVDAPTLQDLIQTAFRASDTRDNWTGDATHFLNDTFTLSIGAVEAALTKKDSIFVIAFRSTEATPEESAVKGKSKLTADQNHRNDEAIVGCFNLVKQSDISASIAWFTVHPRYQQSGLGRELLSYAESYAQQTWPIVQNMELNALSSRDALIAWYERRGYVKTGRWDAFPMYKLPGIHRGSLQGVGFVYLAKSLA